MTNTHNFLPVNKKDMIERGWEQPDFVFITGDAYVDHPSFGPAIISRVLEAHGYKICMIPQPDWKDDKSIDVFGRPRLGFLVSGGNMILWSIIILFQKNIEVWIPILPVERWG